MTPCPTCGHSVDRKWLFDPTSGDLSAGGKTVHLTPTEATILGRLLRADGATIRFRDISKDAVGVHLVSLRAKLEGTGIDIENVNSFGYRVRP